MITITVPTTNDEIVRSKFLETLRTLHGYVQEAKGDIRVNQTYTAKGVYSRLICVEEALEKELANLATSITVTG
jgi:hypothetical protein